MAAWAMGLLRVRNGQTLVAQIRMRRSFAPVRAPLTLSAEGDDRRRKGRGTVGEFELIGVEREAGKPAFA